MATKNVIEVQQADFEREVIERSRQTTVLVDFWAPWCGPCRMLGPILERLAAEPGSQFVLAKINTDQNPQISERFGVRGIPNVKAFRHGRVVDEFVGALPEPRVREFIQRVAGSRPTPAAGRLPTDSAARLRQARELLNQGNGCQAQTLLANFPAGPHAGEAQNLMPLAQFLCATSRGQQTSERADLDVVYRQAADALKRREPSAALYNLLVALHQETAERKARPKEIMHGIFALLGENDLVVAQYRQQLAQMSA
jgi:putative thioredoxin